MSNEDTKAVLVHQRNASTDRMINRLPSPKTRIVWCFAAMAAVTICISTGWADLGHRVVRDGRGVEMVRVSTATFVMGEFDAGIDAQPPHEVTISAFYIDRTEVTYEQFRDFLLANPEWQRENVDPLLADDSYLNDWSGVEYPEHLKDHPVRWVSWYSAAAYAEWRGGRLPTEAEWELAARGTDGRPWPWGWETPDSTTRPLCNYRTDPPEIDGFLLTAPVGSYPAGDSPYGALDMAGNVWEWTADWHDPEYYAESPSLDPRGPDRGTYRVLRGGSWSVPASWTRSTVRLRAYPTRCSDQVGFRCVRDVDDGE